jgi:hypothetical protein
MVSDGWRREQLGLTERTFRLARVEYLNESGGTPSDLVHLPHPMFNVLLFAGLSLVLVFLVVTDCRAHLHPSDAEDAPKDHQSGD